MKLVDKKTEEKKKITINDLARELKFLDRHLHAECIKCEGTGRPKTKTGEPAKTGKNVKCAKCHGTGMLRNRLELIENDISTIRRELNRIASNLKALINKQSIEFRVLPEGNDPSKLGEDGWEGYSGTFDLSDDEAMSIIVGKAKMHFDTYFKDGFYHKNKRFGMFLTNAKSGKKLIEEFHTEE